MNQPPEDYRPPENRVTPEFTERLFRDFPASRDGPTDWMAVSGRVPQQPWFEKRAAKLGPDEIDQYDRRVPGRIKRNPRTFL